MAVTRSDQPSSYGVVELDGDRVVGLTEKPRAVETPSGIINAGVYRFDTAVFDRLRECETDEDGELGITTVIDQYIDDGKARAVRYRGLWLDLSYLWDVPGVSRRVIDRFGVERQKTANVEDSTVVADTVMIGDDVHVGANATIRPGTVLGDNVTVGPNTVLSNVVVYPDATIGAGTVLKDCVVGENTSLGANVTTSSDEISMIVEGVVHEDVTLGGVFGDYAHVGDGVVVGSGTVVGDAARVESGSTVSGTIETGAEVRRG